MKFATAAPVGLTRNSGSATEVTVRLFTRLLADGARVASVTAMLKVLTVYDAGAPAGEQTFAWW